MGRTTRFTLVISTLIFLASSGAPTAEAQEDRARDLERLQEWVELDKSLTPDSRVEALGRIEEWLQAEESVTDVQFFLRVASVTALADNGHSNVASGPVYGFGLLPLRTYWFSDGLYVVRARREHVRLLGARIASIDGVPVDDLADSLSVYHGGTIEEFRQYYATPYMVSPPLLHAAGLSEHGDRSVLELVLVGGERETVTFEMDPPDQGYTRGQPWHSLLPTPLSDQAWVSHSTTAVEPPLALLDPDQAFRYVYLAHQDIVYIQLRSNFASGNQSARDFADEARTRIARDQPTSVILDNRFNPGGDLTRTADFALDLPSMVPSQGRIYVLTSNATFSAGIYTSFFPKAADPERTIVVGERVGDRERFWAESRSPFVLPDSGYRLSYSLQMHDLGEGCPTPQVCHLGGRARWDVALGSLNPDVVIPTTFADFAAGRDPVLEYVLKRHAGVS